MSYSINNYINLDLKDILNGLDREIKILKTITKKTDEQVEYFVKAKELLFILNNGKIPISTDEYRMSEYKSVIESLVDKGLQDIKIMKLFL